MNPGQVNRMPVAQLNPMFGGSLGNRASANSGYQGGMQRVDEPGSASVEVDSSQLQKAAAVGATGNVAFSWVAMAILFGVLMFAGQKMGHAEGNFGSIKLSAFNVVMITFCAVIGIPLAKAFVTKFPIPGVSSIVLSA